MTYVLYIAGQIIAVKDQFDLLAKPNRCFILIQSEQNLPA